MLRAEEIIGSNINVDGEHVLIYAKVLELKLLQTGKYKVDQVQALKTSIQIVD